MIPPEALFQPPVQFVNKDAQCSYAYTSSILTMAFYNQNLPHHLRSTVGESRIITKHAKMVATLTSIFLVILFSGSAVASNQSFPHNGQDGTGALSEAAIGGICMTLVKTRGYACEEHTVTTQDGHVLSLQRIPVGRSGEVPGKRPAVLLQHGLLLDGACWLLLPTDQALAFVLANNGFDVWVANTRGTKYSHGHTSLTADDLGYWNWSWDELATYELPAMFQYVYKETGQKLHYVGHSQGTLLGLAALSKDKSLLDSWRSASLLAPFAYLGKLTSPIARALAENIVANVPYWLDVQEFNPFGTAVIQLFVEACISSGIVDCSDFLSALAGHHCCLNPFSLAATIVHGQPTSTKNVIHISQMITNGTFAMYDYNDENENRKYYGQPTPLEYKLENIPHDFPLYLFHGGADTLCDVKDVQLLLDGLKYHDQNKLWVKYIDQYAHLDFVIGYNSKEVVYDPLMEFLKLH